MGFGAKTENCKVKFSGLEGDIRLWVDSKIVTSVPDSAVSGDITVYLTDHEPISIPFIVFGRIQLFRLGVEVATYGDTVEVYGSGFGNERGNGEVLLDGIEAEIVSWASQKIAFIVPNGLKGSEVQVTRNGAKSNHLFLNILALHGIQPDIAPYGSSIEVYGPNIYEGQIFLDTLLLESEVIAYDRASAYVPYGSKSGPIRILRLNKITNSIWLTVLGIDSLKPNPAGEHTPIVIHGTGFGSEGNVTFENGKRLPEIVSWTDDRIEVITPEDIRSGYVTVQRSGVSAVPVDFHAFRIEELNPDSGSIGDTISIIGENFLDYKITNRVLLGEIEAIIRYWSDTLVWMEIPPDAATGAVRLKARGQTSNPVSFSLED